ncbi:MAG: amino acid ABC transporter substrate-binding protein [Candidatus Magnetomorum sp.]|nr:amino acid ABC transporter substrate-binding protein [Candidatus Magnetomorum sp.]
MRIFQKNLIGLGCLVFLCICFLGAINPVFSAEKRTFSIGWEPWTPYQYEDEQKNLNGLDVELVKTIIKNMNCDIVYKQLPWKRHLAYIERGEIDLAAAASKTPEREAYSLFSLAYRKESTVIFVLKGGSQKYPLKQLADIKNSTFQLGITNGYFYGETFAELMKDDDFKKHVQGVASDTINIKKVLKNRVNGFIGDIYAGVAALKEAGVRSQFEIHPMPVYSSDVYIMFSKKTSTPEDVDKFNQTLKILKENGALEKIFKKYIE